MFWISQVFGVVRGLLGGLGRWLAVGGIAVTVAGGALVWAYQAGVSSERADNEAQRLRAELAAEKDARRREREQRAQMRRTIEEMQADEQRIESETPVATGAGADCRVGPDFVRQVLAGYRGRD